MGHPRRSSDARAFPAYEPPEGRATRPELEEAEEEAEQPDEAERDARRTEDADGDRPEAPPSAAPPPPADDLDAAVHRILRRWRDAATQTEEGHQGELATQLLHVTGAVAAARAGEEPEALGDAVVLQRRLLELLRSELVSLWSEDDASLPDPREMAGTLRAVETVHDRLAPCWDETFATSLEGPSGLELAVEVAHDFRSPLSSILFLADTLRAGHSGEVTDLQRRQLSLVYSAALSMSSMASDVVDLGRGGLTIADREPTRFPVSEVMESVRQMLEPMVEAKGLSMAVRPPEGDLRLGHPEALRRVLLNLSTNAVKFTSEGFIELSGRTRDDSRVEFSVRDTGPGLDQKHGEGLYRPFRPFRGQSGFHFSGTGIGLTIARKLVRAMEGELRHESQRNLGTRFHFTIPLPPVDPI